MDPLPTQSSDDVSIRCPGCGQRFTVGQQLVGRVVECGSCDRRFRVEEDVMVRQRKFYPGEHRDPSLEHFGRVPMRAPVAPSFEPAQYSSDPPPAAAVGPTSPIRIMFGIGGVVLAAIVALILIFGGNPGGALDGAPLVKRLILAAFAGALTLVLLLIANPRSRLKGGLSGAAIAIGLVCLPFAFQDGVHSVPSGEGQLVPLDREDDGEESVVVEDPHAQIKEEMVYQPLQRALDSYEPGGKEGLTAVGIWLRNLRYFNREQVVDFLVRRTGAAEPGGSKEGSWLYPRDEARGDFLLVLRDVEPGLGAVAGLCGQFGEIKRIVEDLSVIEVVVDNDAFVQGDLSALQDSSSARFYELNKRELDSINLERANAAVKRLGTVEPKLYRDDIVRRMQELLEEGDTETKREVAEALSVWAEPGDGSVGAVRKAAAELLKEEGTVPRAVVAFLARSRDSASIPLVHELWIGDSKEWEALYGDFGPGIEDGVLGVLPEAEPLLKFSAVRLLGRVGTPKALPALRSEQQDAASELAVIIGQAIAGIEKRR